MLGATIKLYQNAYGGLSRSIWWLSLVIFVNRCGTMVIPFLTVYLTHNGFTLAQAGYIMAFFGTGSILGSFLGGKLTDRFGYFYVQFFSLFLNGVLFIILGQMHTFTQLAICIFVLSSLGEAFRPANATAIAAYSNESNRTRCYSLNRLAVNLGWAIGPAVGGILAGINYAWLFWVDGITCIFASIMLLIVFSPRQHLQRSKPVARADKAARVRSVYHDKRYLEGMFLVLLISICFLQLFSIVPVYFKEVLHLNEAVIGGLLAMNGLIIVLVEMVLVYKLENRRNVMIYIISGSFMIGLAYLTLDAGEHFLIVLASLVIVTIGEMLLFPFMNNFWVNRSNEKNRGQYAALYNMAFAIGNILAPTLASQIAGSAGYPVLWYFDFGLCTFAAVGFFALKRKLLRYERV